MYQPTKLPDADSQTKPTDPFTLEALAAWLETKPAHEIYCWSSAGKCLFAQYGLWLGLSDDSEVAYDKATDGFHASYGYYEPFGIALIQPRTFGAALSRTRAEIARRSQQGA